ncbi:hypothetical protein V8F20_011655 [Naviculisporaceae sp. PSN 640]
MATRKKPPAQHESEEWSYIPPKYTINLSVPPQHRYDHVSSSPQMQEAVKKADINGLVDWIIEEGIMLLPVVSSEKVPDFVPRLLRKTVRGIAKIALRRVYTDEETEELRGLRRGTGIDLFLLVAFNVLLDLLLGCTSGGVLWDGKIQGVDEMSDDNGAEIQRAPERGDEPVDNGYTTGRFRQTAYRRARQSAETPSTPKSRGSGENGPRTQRNRIAHFRTLDWGMDPLRHLVVEFEYVRYEGGPVIARTVGYFGYVGVLTGLRTGLSMSLNHRPTHTRGSWAKRFSFRWNQLLVLLGVRPSISSTLRYILFSNNNARGYGFGKWMKRDWKKIDKWQAWKFLDLAHPRVETAQTDGDQFELIPTVEKTELDVEAIITVLPMSPSTSAYLVFCTPEKAYSLEVDNGHIVTVQSSATFLTTTNHDLADEKNSNAANVNRIPSAENAAAGVCGMEEVLEESFDRKKYARKAYHKAKRYNHGGPSSSKRKAVPGIGLSLEDIVGIMNYGDIINQSLTHYAVVMDPGTGKIIWRRGYHAEEEEEDDEGDNEDEGGDA